MRKLENRVGIGLGMDIGEAAARRSASKGATFILVDIAIDASRHAFLDRNQGEICATL